MSNLYLVSALFYLITALLVAFDVALVSWGVIPGYSGMAWLRVHFITLGFASQAIFGVLPLLQAARHKAARPKTRLDVWLLLNLGLIILIAGIPIVNKAMILTGGTLVFIAAGLLALHLRQIAQSGQASAQVDWPRRFYGVGLLYLLVGIIVGTGYWLGWGAPLKIAAPIEVHVHANNWGFLSMVFAGLLFSITPSLLNRPLASEKVAKIIFWGMTIGALGLVMGPWLGVPGIPIEVVGLLLHMIITAVLVVVAYKAFRVAGALNDAGAWHVLLSYLWFFMPMLMAPIVVFHLGNIPGERIEGTAPQALVYGWILQFGMALVPYFVARYLLKSEKPQLGGTWLSLALVNVGSALIWLGIFLHALEAPLQGAAYLLLALAALVVALQLWRQVQTVFTRAEEKAMAG